MSLLSKFRKVVGQIYKLSDEHTSISLQIKKLHRELDNQKVLSGALFSHMLREKGVLPSIQDAEFKVFSQFGDDGIIQYLIHILGIKEKRFIEFGVQDYTESNTRFLLINNNWSGLIIDASKRFMDSVRQDFIHWKYDLTVVDAFIDKANVNKLFTDNGFRGNLGILHIDIDGNDYWIWEHIDSVDPEMVIMEYNSVYGYEHPVTVPYDPKFYRTDAHFSNLFWGASLGSLCHLAEKKGYAFLGCNSNGNNAYFVKKEKLGPLKALSPAEGYVQSRFRESVDENGQLNFTPVSERLKAIRECEVYHVVENKLYKIKDLYKV